MNRNKYSISDIDEIDVSDNNTYVDENKIKLEKMPAD